MIAEGDKVMARLIVEGTQRGDFFGIPPTGKHVTWTAVDIFRFVDGKWVEYWLSTDSLGLLQQLRASSTGDM
jgi:predicted ester cyclase